MAAAIGLSPFGFAPGQALRCILSPLRGLERVWVSQCFVATGSRARAASAVMLAAAVTVGVPSAAVRVPPSEILPAAVEALRCMPAASHVEAA